MVLERALSTRHLSRENKILRCAEELNDERFTIAGSYLNNNKFHSVKRKGRLKGIAQASNDPTVVAVPVFQVFVSYSAFYGFSSPHMSFTVLADGSVGGRYFPGVSPL